MRAPLRSSLEEGRASVRARRVGGSRETASDESAIPSESSFRSFSVLRSSLEGGRASVRARRVGGKHTAWGYCHVPAGSTLDMTEAIENQMERFAPGFEDVVRARFTRTAAAYESHNPNYVGGDIGGGKFGMRKLLQVGDAKLFTLGDGIYLGSSAVPPGAGVHGMCGFLAAMALLSKG